MTTETEAASLSFGRYLQSIRIEKGIRLEDVSKETRIRPDTLVYIEEEDHEHLPDIVFVKGFLRAYAKAIGADGDEAVRRYLSRLEVMQKISTSELDLHRSGGVFWRRILLSVGALFCLIAATLYAVSIWRDRPVRSEKSAGVISESAPVVSSTESSIPGKERLTPDKTASDAEEVPTPQKSLTAADEAAGSGSQDTESAELPAVPEAGANTQAPVSGYRLNINTIEETWMKIEVDNQEPKEYNLFPGDQVELEATDSYTLLIGNAGGVKLRLNGKLLDLPGKSGQVATVKLP